MSSEIVNLGFAESINDDELSLSCHMMPCKIGGKPVWLDLKNLPLQDDLKCSSCEEPCVFLCQIYAPIEENEECFHRTIFVFICKKESCCIPNSSKNIITFRSQLSQNNEFYISNIPETEDKPFNLSYWKLKGLLPTPSDYKVSLCVLCGCRGPHLCSQCKTIKYCSKEHQKIDWQKRHKKECGKDIVLDSYETNDYLFPKFEITMDEEETDLVRDIIKEYHEDDESDEDEIDAVAKMEEFNKFVKNQNAHNEDLTEKDLEKFALSENDKEFLYFKKRISPYSDQVIRYERNGEPLWVTSKNKINKSVIPKCENCGSSRIFEFQIMPQLLVSLKEEHLDWGIIAVYTCEQNCKAKDVGYMKEFAYKQDVTI